MLDFMFKGGIARSYGSFIIREFVYILRIIKIQLNNQVNTVNEKV